MSSQKMKDFGESFQYEASLATTGARRGTSHFKFYNELDLETIEVENLRIS